MKVIFSDYFKREFENFDESWQLTVNLFIFHIQKNGMRNLKGRNKSSADLTDTTKKGKERATHLLNCQVWRKWRTLNFMLLI